MLPCKSKGWDTAAIMFNENDTLSTISTYISFLCVLVSSHNMYHLLICGFFQVQLANRNQPVACYASKRLKEMPSSESRWVTYLSVDWECIYSLPPEYATWIWIFAFIALSDICSRNDFLCRWVSAWNCSNGTGKNLVLTPPPLAQVRLPVLWLKWHITELIFWSSLKRLNGGV